MKPTKFYGRQRSGVSGQACGNPSAGRRQRSAVPARSSSGLAGWPKTAAVRGRASAVWRGNPARVPSTSCRVGIVDKRREDGAGRKRRVRHLRQSATLPSERIDRPSDREASRSQGSTVQHKFNCLILLRVGAAAPAGRRNATTVPLRRAPLAWYRSCCTAPELQSGGRRNAEGVQGFVGRPGGKMVRLWAHAGSTGLAGSAAALASAPALGFARRLERAPAAGPPFHRLDPENGTRTGEGHTRVRGNDGKPLPQSFLNKIIK